MNRSPTLLLGGSTAGQVQLLAAMANRHGLVAGATGTGKTVTLQVLAEGFSRLGVPVFLADVKGDLSGLARPANPHPKIDERVQRIGIGDYAAEPNPVLFWDLDGVRGHPLRATVSELGPLLLSNLFELNETQSGVLYAAFRIADDEGLLLLDLKDLRALLNWVGEHASELRGRYGNITTASLGAIQRRLLVLEEEGGEQFLGEPALALADLMQRDFSGRGAISVLDVTRLVHAAPRLYATVLLWLLSELFENLPEVGDAERPKLVLFFDEAHLLFDGAPKALVDKIEQVVRLIRSKGVGVFFVTQSPLDVPDEVLGQLGMKVQHALRAFTPRDRKAIAAVADSFPQNPEVDTRGVLTELGVGEALVSTLDAKGRPTPVQRTLLSPPRSRIGPLDDDERREQLARSPLAGRYDQAVDRESAHELLAARAAQGARAAAREAEQQAARKAEEQRARSASRSSGRSRRESVGEAVLKSTLRSVGSTVGRSLGQKLVRGLLGGLFGGRR
ncbi:MAG TPA: helicase HerA-like domain-containing protein [Gammaproteobacteria bacterium]